MGLFSRADSQVQKIIFLLDPIIKLLPRLIIGAVFIPAGWGKLQNISHTIDYFKSLNIPLAVILAPITALSEVTFGIFILVGFFTRVSAVPLFVIMTVALLTAHRAELGSPYALVETMPALYAVIILCILALGSGSISLDQLLFRRR